MLSYYISGSNQFTIRTENITSRLLTLHLDNLYTNVTSSYDLSGSSEYTAYENILVFSQSLEGVVEVGDEFLLHILDSGSKVWDGSLQVYKQQEIVKSDYDTQNDGYISNVSTNDYIILD
jgi:hypothetical protein